MANESAQQQNMAQDLAKGAALGDGKVVTRTDRNAAGEVTIEYQDGTTTNLDASGAVVVPGDGE